MKRYDLTDKTVWLAGMVVDDFGNLFSVCWELSDRVSWCPELDFVSDNARDAGLRFWYSGQDDEL